MLRTGWPQSGRYWDSLIIKGILVAKECDCQGDPDERRKENIVLDARVREMISSRAFRATLRNGHVLVAYLTRAQRDSSEISLNVGDVVPVRMSPYDMSRGEVVHNQDTRS